jgi:hypothetical protein
VVGFSPNFAAKSINVVFFCLLNVGNGKGEMKEDWVHIFGWKVGRLEGWKVIK